MRLIDGNQLKRKAQKVATEAWKMNLTARIETVLNQFIDWIDKAPTIEPEPHWIPCSERLPEVNGRYLVTRGLVVAGALWNRVYIANYSDLMRIKSERIWWQGNVGKSDFERLDDVVSWMPLPEPYRKRMVNGD